MAKTDESFIKFVVGLVSGVISGVVAGLLIAPKTGHQMREDIINRSREIKDITKDKLLGLQELSKGQAQKVKSTFQDQASKISSKLDELAKRGSDILIQDEVQ